MLSRVRIFRNLQRRSFSMATGLRRVSEDEEMIISSAAKFAALEIQPKVKWMDDNEEIDGQLLSKLFENGFMGIETSPEYSGLGGSFTSAILCIKEISKVDPSVATLVDVHNTLVNSTIKNWATEEQKKKYLTRLATNAVGSFCLSEESSGSDAFALKTTARKENGKYIINGTKMWISNSFEAEIFLIFANLDPSKGYKGITCFIVEKKDGVQVGKKEKKLGIRASSTCQLTFENLEIPTCNLLGKEGEGYKIAIEILNEGRIGIGAQMVGVAQGAFEATMPYLFQRKQFKSLIGDFQGMQHQYAQLWTEIQAAELLVINASRMQEDKVPFVAEAAMAKLYASQVAERTTSKCIEWMGGLGFTRDFIMEKFYRDCKIGSIYEGTSNIQLQTIAKGIKSAFLSK